MASSPTVQACRSCARANGLDDCWGHRWRRLAGRRIASSGTRGRHEIPNERLAVVVDDGVLAGAIGGVAQRSSGVSPSRVVTSVTRRRGAVVITPTSGVPLDSESLASTAQEFVRTLQPRPAVTVGVTVSKNGVVGA